MYELVTMLGWKNGACMKLLDIYHLSMLRPDGHPSPYRSFHPLSKDNSAKVQNDCLYWCLHGPIDKWNTLIMEMMLTEEELKKFVALHLYQNRISCRPVEVLVLAPIFLGFILHFDGSTQDKHIGETNATTLEEIAYTMWRRLRREKGDYTTRRSSTF